MFNNADAVAQADCQLPTAFARVQVQAVIDGDTVLLTTGRRLRLIGIDAPELTAHSDDTHNLALNAKAAVADLIGSRGQLLLVSDRQLVDRFQRVLAHAFLPDGRNLEVALLRSGLADVLSIPPNGRFDTCYREAVSQARQDRLGVWADIERKALNIDVTPTVAPGFRTVVGTVSGVRRRGKSLFVDLGPGFSISLADTNGKRGGGENYALWQGRRVGAKGRVYHRRGRGFLRIRHAHDLWLY